MLFVAITQYVCGSCVCWTRCFCPGRFGDAPYAVFASPSALQSLQAAFIKLSHAKASCCSLSIFKSPAGDHEIWLQRTGHEPVCLVPEWPVACLYLPGLFESILTHVLRAFCSPDIGITTALSCEKPTCFVPELLVGSLYQLDPGSEFYTAHSL